MAKKKVTREQQKYTAEEKDQKAQEIRTLIDKLPNFAIDKIISFVTLMSQDLKKVDFVKIEDTYTKRVVEKIKDFAEIKNAAKFRALEKLEGIIKVEEDIIQQYNENIKKYIAMGICSHWQQIEYLKKQKSKKAKK